ncbi:MAG: phosphoribosylglycinamide formyltransferase [Rhodothermales bacterium]|nr:phosphoribosylglycinamide formyltransferase [Rhodothermales bacterium]
MQLAVFASGSGSNLEAIFNAIDAGRLPATVALVLSNKAGVFALERARLRDVPTIVLDPTGRDEAAYLADLLGVLNTHGVDFIALAGYLKKIPAGLVAAFHGRMLNIHPALLPAFGGPGMFGQRIHRAAIEYGVRWTGATVHLVDEAYDTGPVVLQEPVPVKPDDTPEVLAARVLALEHRLFPEALALFAAGRVRLEGRRVFIDEAPRPPAHAV